MPSRVVKRSAALAACLTLLVSSVAFADVVGGDRYPDVEGNQTVYDDLPATGPGGQVEFDVWFNLVCKNGSHVEPLSTIAMSLSSATLSADMAVDVDPGVIGPIPADWPVAPTPCFGSPTLLSGTPAHVTLTAPTTPGDDYPFTLIFRKDPSTGTTGFTSVSGSIDVVGNTPPVLHVPVSMEVEGNTTGGWTGAYGASATDAEDDPDPTPSCSPPASGPLPVGTTSVQCTVTDGGGMHDSGSFTVTVSDTTSPVLSGVPGDRTVTTGGSSAVVTYALPTATDIVDASPTVGCAPASGSSFPVGTTQVTCTATDDADNAASATFRVTVVHASAVFFEPVGNAGTFVVSSSRTIPIKVQLFRDGNEVTSGEAWVWLGRCGEASTMVGELERQAGRWQGHLDTSGLGAGCYQVTVRAGGATFGGFELRIDDGATTGIAAKPKKKG